MKDEFLGLLRLAAEDCQVAAWAIAGGQSSLAEMALDSAVKTLETRAGMSPELAQPIAAS